MKKKIIFVINTMGRAGAEKCLLTMLKYMDKEKYDISLFSVINRGELFSSVPEGVRILNHDPCCESVLDRKAKLYLAKRILKNGCKGGYFLKEAPYLREVLSFQRKQGKIDFKKLFFKLLSDHAERQEETYDLAVAYIQGAATYYVMDHIRAKKKIAFLHNEFLESGYSPKLEKSYYRRADAIFCVSESVCRHFAEVYPNFADKMSVFYNLLDVEDIRKKALKTDGMNPAFKKAEGETVLLTAARLARVKAYDIAVPALAMVRKKGYRVKWYVLGDGPMKAEIKKLIQKYHVADSFILLGTTDNPYPYMSGCDIYVQATRYEGCCTSISEAVILGKPVIASDCDGNKEQLNRYQTGTLVSLSAGNLAKAIIRVINEQKKAGGFHGTPDMGLCSPAVSLQRIYDYLENSEA